VGDNDQNGRRGGAVGPLLDALGDVLGQVARPSAVLERLLHAAARATSAERGVFVAVGDAGSLSYRVLYRFEPQELGGAYRRYSSTIFARVLESGRGVRIASAVDDATFSEAGSIHDMNLVSVLCQPVRIDGRIAGLVHLEHGRPDHFTVQHERLLASLLELSVPVLRALEASERVLARNDELREASSRAQEALELDRGQLVRDWSFGRFIGRSAAVRALGHSVARAARSEFPVMLIGETGTGKSILARVLHHQSRRAQGSFVTVFCPSLEKGLVEAELFGHRRGAFTGAVADRIGKVQAAEGGTLFLDEIGELPPEIQPKLLRLLQERTYERVGDPYERRADVRVIAATNRDLRREVQEGRFRRDLYERLNYVPLRVPPLRERRYDIPVLLRHALDQLEEGRWIELSADAERYLMELDFAWPGNVRHLEQLAARLALTSPNEPVSAAELEGLLEPGGIDAAPVGDFESGLPEYLERAERQWLEEALRRYADVPKKELARKLNIGESTLHKKIKLYRLDPD
jgi:transcriptional regulator with GAF, ATPase, and Fis domain